MIVISGEVRIDPAQLANAIALARELMTETRKLDGCISYVIMVDIEDSGLLHVFEEWENEDALRAHLSGPSVAAARRQLDGLGMRAFDLERFDVRSVGPIA